MEKIVRIHFKVLDFLIKLRNHTPDLYFVPRKINNQNRLDKGYWFIGNENYLNISFWDGSDTNEKVHNIGFVIKDDKHSFIEFSSQDNNEKSKFLSRLANHLGGFHKRGQSNKWYKFYSNKDYIKNLDNFIKKTKPLIDKFIISEKPKGISLLNKSFFDKYTNKIIQIRKKQIEYGIKNKVARISWNLENWKFPSGPIGKSKNDHAYENDKGYGHEEWLLDKSRIVNDFHYSFLQPLKSPIHIGKKYNISLITFNNLGKRYYVGDITNVERISKKESSDIYAIYKSNNWINEMRDDIKRIRGNWKEFLNTRPEDFFNVKFKFNDVKLLTEMEEVSLEDINLTAHRFKLLPKKKGDILTVDLDDDEGGDEDDKLKNTGKRKRVFNVDVEFDPFHDKMQNALKVLLKKPEYNYLKVLMEKSRVDIKAKKKNGKWDYFEIKTDNPKLSIRKALGQIMEYSYYPTLEKADNLIIISSDPPNPNDIEYIKYLRNKFKLPITYRYFILDKNYLSKDY